MKPVDALVAVWRSRAQHMRRYGAEAQAVTLEACAKELEEASQAWQQEALTLEEAVKESGYTRSHLKRLLRDQAVSDSGAEGETRILRCHLPRKPGYGVAPPLVCRPITRTQVARAIAAEGDI